MLFRIMLPHHYGKSYLKIISGVPNPKIAITSKKLASIYYTYEEACDATCYLQELTEEQRDRYWQHKIVDENDNEVNWYDVE